MNPFWGYIWPCIAAGLLVGAITGIIAFRHGRNRKLPLAIGATITLVLAALWHGPLGAANRFSVQVEGDLQRILVHYEMTQVSAHLHHDPLTRRVLLSGPADDFQHGELARLINELPGVSGTSWSPKPAGLPLIVEGVGVAVLGFLLGLLLAYLLELRRRYNAQWTW